MNLLDGVMPTQSFCGIPVHVSSLTPEGDPVCALSQDVMVTPEYRERFNEYLAAIFGRKEMAFIMGGEIFVRPENAAKLEAIVKAGLLEAIPEPCGRVNGG